VNQAIQIGFIDQIFVDGGDLIDAKSRQAFDDLCTHSATTDDTDTHLMNAFDL
jgi:hypothetical protein